MTILVGNTSITGGAQTGLTSPTYTLAEDLSPAPGARQFVVTALGGTQTNARASSNGDPFTVTVRRDQTYKSLPARNPVTGAYSVVPRNKVEILIRKGTKIDSLANLATSNIRIIAEVAAGSEANDAVNLRAMCSLAVGVLTEETTNIGDGIVSGVI